MQNKYFNLLAYNEWRCQANISNTRYLHGFQYYDNVLQFFHTPEGYVKNTPIQVGFFSFDYVYNYTDHLGNIRVSYTQDPRNGNLTILNENHYYPFGLQHKNYNSGQWDIKLLEEENNEKGIDDDVEPGPLAVKNRGYQYKFNGMELQKEFGVEMYDFGARNYDPALVRWMNIDPLAEMMRRHSPYNFTFNNPMRFIDPDGMSPFDVVIQGGMEQEAFIELQASVSAELTLSMDSDGKVNYERNFIGPLTEDSTQLVKAIDDSSITVNVTAENTFFTSKQSLYIGGAFMGNTVTTGANGNTVVAEQEINPNVLGIIDRENGTPGSLTLHEVTEAYQGALITQQSGNSVGPATNADVNNPNSVYSRAHDAATPQRMTINQNVYDANGNLMLNYKPGQRGAAKVEFTTQGGTVLFTYQ